MKKNIDQKIQRGIGMPKIPIPKVQRVTQRPSPEMFFGGIKMLQGILDFVSEIRIEYKDPIIEKWLGKEQGAQS